MARQNLI